MKHLPNDHIDNAIQHKNKLCNDYFRSYKVHQMLTAFMLLCMIFIISLFQLCLVLVGKSWWRQISDRYLTFGMNYLI